MDEKTALVTGASRGIGRSIALTLAQSGYDVAVNYAGNAAKAQDVVSEIERLGQRGMSIQADVSDASEAKGMIKEVVDRFGKLDVLVNNAGITRDNLLMRMKEDDWDAVMDINLKGVFHCIQAAARPMMKKRFGRIINISSVVGVVGNPGQANYVSAKAGMIGLTKSAAKEMASRGITVNAVAPGFIETDMTDELDAETRDELLAQIPLGHLGDPKDIANAVCFLASDEARYMTGQTLHVNGGMAM